MIKFFSKFISLMQYKMGHDDWINVTQNDIG